MRNAVVFISICFFCLTAPLHADKIPLILASSGESGKNFAHETFARFMFLVEEKAPGVFDIQYRPSLQMGDETESVRLVQTGKIQMATLLSNTMTLFSPSTGWMNMPYFFEKREDFHKAAWGLWDKTNERMAAEAGCRILSINEIGFRNLTTDAEHPVRNLKEARKIRIRIPASPLGLALYKKLGLTALPINFGETFAALSRGQVEGQESAYAIVTLKKFYEVQKYVLDIEMSLHVGLLIVSERWFQSLDQTLQKALVEAGKEATRYEFDVLGPRYLERDREIMEEAGMVFLGPPDDIEEWRKLGRSAWPQVYAIIGQGDAELGKSLVDEAASYFKVD